MMQDELTEKMHSEFTVDEETENCLRAGCVWLVLDMNASKEDVKKAAEEYGVDYNIALNWKNYWFEKKKNNG